VPEPIGFRSGQDECVAALFRPDVPARTPMPCIVMGNGFSLTQRDGIPMYAERFAAAGFAALTFDYRCLGESGGKPRQLVDPRRQLTDFAAAVAHARTLEGIDPGRIAVWGYSLGGGVALRAAADDDRIAAAVTLCPAADQLAVMLTLDPSVNLRLGASWLRNRFTRKTVTVPAIGPPGSFAVLNQAEVLPGFQDIENPESLWRNEVCAQVFRPGRFFRPIRHARRIGCPLMLCLGERDTVVPARPIERVAKRAPRAELHRYPIDHFDAFRRDGAFERVVADQIAFLNRHLKQNQRV
jgi:dienelactone hydrolase